MSTIVRPAVDHAGGVDTSLVAEPVTMPLVLLRELSAPSAVAVCSQQLPRDALVRLRALSAQVADIRRERPGHSEFSLRLEKVAVGLDAVIQSIYDETVVHYAVHTRSVPG